MPNSRQRPPRASIRACRGRAGRLLTTSVALSLALLGSAAQAQPPRADGGEQQFTIGTYNIKAKVATPAVVHDLQRLNAAGVDVLGLQELRSAGRKAAIQRSLTCASCPFDAFLLDNSGPATACPILWRRSQFRLLGGGAKRVTSSTYVGPRGAGGSILAAKYVVYAKLEHIATGTVIYVLNNHAVPTVDVPHPSRKRLHLHHQHMLGLKNLVREKASTGAAVFAVGDFNVDYRRDDAQRSRFFPYAMMAQVGAYSNWSLLGAPAGGTHGSRLIDYVFSRTDDDITARAQSILSGFHSDHKPVLVRYGVSAPPPPPPATPPPSPAAADSSPSQTGLGPPSTAAPHRHPVDRPRRPEPVDPAQISA